MVIWGIRAVEEALASETPVQTLYVLKQAKGKVERLLLLARKRGAKIVEVPKKVLDQYSLHHQGVVLLLSPVELTPCERVVAEVKMRGGIPLLLALDGVEDAGNMGAILRSAEAMGVHCVMVPKRRSASITPAVVRSSAGALFHLAIDKVTNLSRALRKMKDEGLWVVGTHLEKGSAPWDVDLTLPLVVVVGNEERGISRMVRKICDFLVKIPMEGKVGSLNVSAATVVLLYEVLRQRKGRLP